jgi:hypothetical protein
LAYVQDACKEVQSKLSHWYSFGMLLLGLWWYGTIRRSLGGQPSEKTVYLSAPPHPPRCTVFYSKG